MKKITLLLIALFAVASTGLAQSEPDYLCFEVKAGTKISLKIQGNIDKCSVSYKIDDETTWWTLTTEEMEADCDCKVYFKDLRRERRGYYLSLSESSYVYFSVSKEFKCSGNIMSLIDATCTRTQIATEYCFNSLFKDCPMTVAPKLPAIILSKGCYQNMFSGCTKLVEMPELPATTLAENCYKNMFEGCTSLTKTTMLPATSLVAGCYWGMFLGCTKINDMPELPATTLAENCYINMFKGCTSLTETSMQNATTLAVGCYYGMFEGCSALTTIPELPCTVLAENCYARMFAGCKRLTYVPELPATTMVKGCYSGMFENCTSITEPPALPSTELAEKCYYGMFSGCTSIKIAPMLPAETLVTDCYAKMFYNCKSLRQIYIKIKDWGAPANYTTDWLYNVSSSGVVIRREFLTGTLILGSYVWPKDWFCKYYDHRYSVNVSDKSITVDKTKATYEDEVNFTIHAKDGFKLDKVFLNDVEISIVGNKGSFKMSDIMKDVTINAEFTKIEYSIEPDEFTEITNPHSAWTIGDNVNLQFAKRDGYGLVSATYNGSPLSISNYKSSFTMPAGDVVIKTFYSKAYNIEYDDWTQGVVTATVYDKVIVEATDRTNVGLRLDKILVDNTEIPFSDYSGSFDMIDFGADIKISTVYSLIDYIITTDEYTTASEITAHYGDLITLRSQNRPGYNLYKIILYSDNDWYPRYLYVSNNMVSFTMRAENYIECKTDYQPIYYTIEAGEHVILDKNIATIEDKVSITVDDLSSEGLLLEKILINGMVFTGTQFDMKDYLENVKVEAVYTNNNFTIVTDDYSSADKMSANSGDLVNITFQDRSGYSLSSATCNGNNLAISNYSATFTMPTADVTITTNYTPIYYNVSCPDQYVSVDKSSATIDDAVTITIADRTSENYTLSRVLVNETEISVANYTAQINMSDFLTDVTITAEYTYVEPTYTITSDDFTSSDHTTAKEGETISLTFAQREGYELTSAVYNGNVLVITDNKATFPMPAADVTIATNYTPINYNVSCSDQYVSVDKSSATIDDAVTITIADRTSENYTLSRVLVNETEVSVNNFTAQFSMSDYFTDVTIKAEYTYTEPPKTEYTITTAENCSADRATAYEGDVVNVSFFQRDGYDLVSAYYNSTSLNVVNYQASFTMPAEDVSVTVEYTEIYYTVSTDQYSSTDKTRYTQGETVTVTFTKRDGYNLASATINGAALNLDGYTATFEMPSNDVLIGAEYKEIEKPIEYPITNTSEYYVTVSTTSAKPGDEVTVFVSRRDGYTPHVFVNGAEVIINGNVAKYIQPSASVVITVDYQKDATTAVAEVSDNNTAVSVYPNPARQGEKIVISIDSGIDLKNAKILIYNSHGAIVKRIDHAAEYNETSLKSGVYNGVLIYKNGRQTFRIAVY